MCALWCQTDTCNRGQNTPYGYVHTAYCVCSKRAYRASFRGSISWIFARIDPRKHALNAHNMSSARTLTIQGFAASDCKQESSHLNLQVSATTCSLRLFNSSALQKCVWRQETCFGLFKLFDKIEFGGLNKAMPTQRHTLHSQRCLCH